MRIQLIILSGFFLALASCSSGGMFIEMERQNDRPSAQPPQRGHRVAEATPVAVEEQREIDEEERLRAEVEELERKKRLRQLRRDRERLLAEEKQNAQPAQGADTQAEPAAEPATENKPGPVDTTPKVKKPQLPGDQFGLVTSFRKGEPAIVMIDVGTDDNVAKGQAIIFKQNGKEVCRGLVSRASKSKSMVYVTKSGWVDGKVVDLHKNDPIYLAE